MPNCSCCEAKAKFSINNGMYACGRHLAYCCGLESQSTVDKIEDEVKDG